jgi:hypothetical protein
MLSPLATRVKDIVDGVYRAQKYGRRFRVPVHELNAVVEEVDALEKQVNSKSDYESVDKPKAKQQK